MKTLQLTSVASGKVLDTITLTDGAVAYDTGAAREIATSIRARLGGEATDADLFAAMAGWSNGYLAISAPAGDET